MKRLLSTFLLVFLSAMILVMMDRYGLLQFSRMKQAFSTGFRWVVFSFLSHIFVQVCLAIRYWMFLRIFEVKVKFSHVTAATFVSSAVGQWAPGSLAIMELLRMGLMIGADKHLSQQSAGAETGVKPVEGVKARIAVASLFDRLVGFFTMLMIGALIVFCIPTILMPGELSRSQEVSLFVTGTFFLGGALFIGASPFLARVSLFHTLLNKARLYFVNVETRQHGALKGVARKIAGLCKSFISLRETVVIGSSKLGRIGPPIFMSILCLLGSCLALYFASFAILYDIGFFPILAGFPVTALSSLLPISFGGMGGQQLVAVGIFSLFNLDSEAVGTASLLQNGLLLLANTFLGLLFAQLSASQIKAIFKDRKKASVEI
jgi:uncharacterized membrane protein YbhN (UPF0104 family)